MTTYAVHVGNVGRVHEGKNRRVAMREYRAWIAVSKCKTGRASGEAVMLFVGDDLLREYDPASEAEDREQSRTADRIDGYDRDDLGESNDY